MDAGFNNLIRPVLYNAYHHVINLTSNSDHFESVTGCFIYIVQSYPLTVIYGGINLFFLKIKVVGNICESGDVFNHEVLLKDTVEGDLLASNQFKTVFF